MSLFKKLTLLLLLSTSSVHAFTPESGFWFSPNGYGVSIEIQDNFLFAAIYVYDETGEPIWYSAGAPLVGNSLFDSELNLTVGGSCIDCPSSTPTTFVGEGGPVTIDFTSETTGTIQFNGQIQPLQRFNFLLGDELEKMLGEWQVVIDASQFIDTYPFTADVLVFRQVEVVDGDRLVTGCRSESTVFNSCTQFALDNSDMAAYFDFDLDELFVIVRDDPDQFLIYRLTVGLDQFDGTAITYSVNSQPPASFLDGNTDGFIVRGFRSASRTFVESGSGPSKTVRKEVQKARPGLSSFVPNEKILEKTTTTYEAADLSEKGQRVFEIIQMLQNQLENKNTQ
ncbi:hypothetical protein [Marinicella sp. W31]|uniref:hypothetical protein n=1 Tax=Marinicella sp. W31 TaxID=3023713 RepID=UPI0037564CF9